MPFIAVLHYKTVPFVAACLSIRAASLGAMGYLPGEVNGRGSWKQNNIQFIHGNPPALQLPPADGGGAAPAPPNELPPLTPAPAPTLGATPPLPCVSAAFVPKTLPFLAEFQGLPPPPPPPPTAALRVPTPPLSRR